MEESVFFQPEVLRELKRYVEVRLHIDKATEASKRLAKLKEERLNDVSLPIYEIVDPETGKTLPGGVLKGARPEEFRQLLASFRDWKK